MSKKRKRLFKLFQAVGFQRNEFDEELKTWKGYTYAQIRSHYKNVTLPSSSEVGLSDPELSWIKFSAIW